MFVRITMRPAIHRDTHDFRRRVKTGLAQHAAELYACMTLDILERCREEFVTRHAKLLSGMLGELKPLPLAGGGERILTMYLVLADPEGAGPGVRRLAEILRASAKNVE